MLENDDSAKNYFAEINGKKYSFEEHATAAQIKATLGNEYSNFKTFGFVRNPLAKRVSGYHFWKNGNPISKGHSGPLWPLLIRIWFARLLPFKIWNILYPVKTNKEYFTDENGELIVDRIFLYENIEEDFIKSLKFIGLYKESSKLPFKNRSNHGEYKKYYNDGKYKYIVEKKMKEDIEFYNNHPARDKGLHC